MRIHAKCKSSIIESNTIDIATMDNGIEIQRYLRSLTLYMYININIHNKLFLGIVCAVVVIYYMFDHFCLSPCFETVEPIIDDIPFKCSVKHSAVHTVQKQSGLRYAKRMVSCSVTTFEKHPQNKLQFSTNCGSRIPKQKGLLTKNFRKSGFGQTQ